MIIKSVDGKRRIDVGGADIWNAVYSTVESCLGDKRDEYSLAFDFLENGKCSGKEGFATAKQINHIRDELSQFTPDRAVYDIDDKSKKAPWQGKLSPVITSCANMFTSADGQDLLYECVSILVYAQIVKTDVIIE